MGYKLYSHKSRAVMFVGMVMVPVASLRRTQYLFPNENVLVVAVSNGIRAVKLCSNKILWYLTRGAGLHVGREIVTVSSSVYQRV